LFPPYTRLLTLWALLRVQLANSAAPRYKSPKIEIDGLVAKVASGSPSEACHTHAEGVSAVQSVCPEAATPVAPHNPTALVTAAKSTWPGEATAVTAYTMLGSGTSVRSRWQGMATAEACENCIDGVSAVQSG
jgi:hypothetical protein